VAESNPYVHQNKHSNGNLVSKKSRGNEQKRFTKDEIWMTLALFMLMGII
jgi:hypothetical protein